MTDSPDNTEPSADDNSLTFLQLLGSTAAAAFGVQSSSNRKRDFAKGKAIHFILMGVGFTVLFVFAVLGVVSLVLP